MLYCLAWPRKKAVAKTSFFGSLRSSSLQWRSIGTRSSLRERQWPPGRWACCVPQRPSRLVQAFVSYSSPASPQNSEALDFLRHVHFKTFERVLTGWRQIFKLPLEPVESLRRHPFYLSLCRVSVPHRVRYFGCEKSLCRQMPLRTAGFSSSR